MKGMKNLLKSIVSEKRPTLKFCPSQWLNADHYIDEHVPKGAA